MKFTTKPTQKDLSNSMLCACALQQFRGKRKNNEALNMADAWKDFVTFSDSRAPIVMDFKKQSIKTSVVACIIDEQERVLLTRRCIEPFCGQWVMPGGKVDLGEPLAEALHREVREEVGIEVHIDGLLDVYEHVAYGDNKDHYVILYYRAHPLTNDLVLRNEEVSEAMWVSSKHLAKYNMTPGTSHILARVFPETMADPGTPSDELASRKQARALDPGDPI
jgi:8-oxo-dGTP diphosphatase